MIIVGEKEQAEGKVAVRSRNRGDLGAVPADEFIEMAIKEDRERTR